MRVVVLSAATGELVCDHTNALFWRMRGWEFRGWLCEVIRCTQYFSVILLVRQLLLCDMAYIGEYAEGDFLTVYMLRRGIADPSDCDFNIRRTGDLGRLSRQEKGMREDAGCDGVRPWRLRLLIHVVD